MPLASPHRHQANTNIQLLGEPVFQNGAYPDWQVTIAFYAAVHHVEATFAQRYGVHSTNHSDRHSHLYNHWPQSFKFYKMLEDRSKWSRYDCKPMTPQLVQEARYLLNQVQQLVV